MSTLDRVLRVLSEKRRRHILYALDERDAPISVEVLAAQIATYDEPPTPELGTQHNRLKIELIHNHLPMMADEDFIHYDHDEGHIELANLPPGANKLLTVTKDLDRPNNSPD